jgi:hypothetical protein
MTPRQARTARRAADRKAKKIARKAATGIPSPERSDTVHPAPAAQPRYNPELEREFQIHGNSIRDRIARQTASGASACTGFVSQDTAAGFARAETNRANAHHSTGPRTSAGKLASSRNSFKHGLASAQLIIPGEDPAAFDALLAALLDEHQPANPTEDLLVQQIAQSFWLAQRAIRLQNQCFSSEAVDEKRLSLFLRYQTTYERAFHKALSMLLKLKKDRPRGFVSQTGDTSESDFGFVSQNTSLHGFVSQEYVDSGTPEPVSTDLEALKVA